MASTKIVMLPYKRPEQQILARILTQALEDAGSLQNLKTDYEFKRMRNDLWSFFHSDWFFEILSQLDLDAENPVWDATRKKIWNCTTHRTYIRPDRRKEEKE